MLSRAGISRLFALRVQEWIELAEVTTPTTPAANTLRLFVEDVNGFSFYSFIDSTGMVRKIVRDSVFVGRNETGSTIALGTPVYASGSTGTVPTIAPAKSNTAATMPSVGVTVEAIVNNAFGRVMQVGLLENIDTSAFSVGDVLYVDAAVAGDLTATAPLYPNIRQEIGVVLVDGVGNGSLQVIARSMSNEGTLDHGGLLGLADDDHPQYIKEAFPVGSVFLSVVATNPATLLGYGTWSQIAAGRMLVGIDSGDTDFDTVEKTGGAKTKDLEHKHVSPLAYWASNAGKFGYTAIASYSTATGSISWVQRAAVESRSIRRLYTALAGSATQDVMNPYFVVYIWKRTA